MPIVEAAYVPILQRPQVTKRLAVAAVVAALAVAAFAAVVVTRHYDHRYGPVADGNTGGAYDVAAFRSETRDDFGPVVIDGPAGTTASMFSMLTNDGDHDVTVTDVERNYAVSDVRWSVYRRSTSGLGENTQWQRFPATVPAHGQIRLLQLLRQPACATPRRVGAGSYLSSHLEVHWQSLLHDHVTDIQGPDYPKVHLC